MPEWGGAPDVAPQNLGILKSAAIGDDKEKFLKAFYAHVDPSNLGAADELVTVVSRKTCLTGCNLFNAVTTVVSEDGEQQRVLAVHVPSNCFFEEQELRDSILSLFDLAENVLRCKSVILFLEKNRVNIAEMIHALGFVGFVSAEYLMCADASDDYCLLRCQV